MFMMVVLLRDCCAIINEIIPLSSCIYFCPLASWPCLCAFTRLQSTGTPLSSSLRGCVQRPFHVGFHPFQYLLFLSCDRSVKAEVCVCHFPLMIRPPPSIPTHLSSVCPHDLTLLCCTHTPRHPVQGLPSACTIHKHENYSSKPLIKTLNLSPVAQH